MLKINGWYGRGGGHIKQLVYATYFAEATKSTLRYPHHGWLKNEPISFGDNNTSINRGFFYSKDLDGHIPTVYDIYRIGKTILNSQMTCTRFSVPSDSLVIHLRSGDVFKPSPHRAYVQPPLSLYDKIIKTERYKKVIVVTDPSRSNPCLKPLVKKYSADVISIDSMRDFGYLMSAQRLNQNLQLKCILPTMFDQRTKHSFDILRKLNRLFRKQICEPIRYNVRLSEAPMRGKTIFEYRSSASGARDYKQLIRRVHTDGH